MSITRTTRRALLVALTSMLLVAALALPAAAHGEAAQEGFLRMRTIGFWDVEFSDTTIRQGESLTISGKARVMETWPNTLGDPETAFLGIISPGPKVALESRTINGQPVPNRFEIDPGQVFDWEMVVSGRVPGRWHIHPGFAVKGSGTLLGPGEWITIEENPDGYAVPVQLANGNTVNLENYGLTWVWGWQTVSFLIGMGWLLYWIGPKPTVTRAAVSLRVPLNSDGGEVGLITERDHKAMNLFAIAVAAMLAVGWIYQATAYPDKLAPQVLELALPSATELDADVVLRDTAARFDPATHTLNVSGTVTNNENTPLELVGYSTSTLRFDVDSEESPLVTEPQRVVIAPGETESVSLAMQSHLWTEEQLVQLVGAGRERIAGLLVFEGRNGERKTAEFDAVIRHRFSGSQ